MKLSSAQTILTGKAMPYTWPGSASAIDKMPQIGALQVGRSGIEGDEHGDMRVHGGPDKAIHHYPYDHYQHWRSVYGGKPIFSAPGAFGENISSHGLTEADVCLGDIISCGSTLLQITQTRQPCWKLNDRVEEATAAEYMQSSGRVGWYYRVLQEGVIEAGDDMHLVDRPHGEWSLQKVLELLYQDTMNLEALRELQMLNLPPSWGRLVHNRIGSRTVESWRARLEGPSSESEGETP